MGDVVGSGAGADFSFTPALNTDYEVRLTVAYDGGSIASAPVMFHAYRPLSAKATVAAAQDPSAADLWYRVESVASGFVTLEAIVPTGSPPVGLELFDAAMQPLGTSTLKFGNQRIEPTAPAGGTAYYVRLTGDAVAVDLRLTNLVAQTGGAVTVANSDEADTFDFTSTNRRFTIRGVTYDLAAQGATSFTFHGGPGDAAILRGNSQAETANLYPLAADWTDGIANVTVDGAPQITFRGSGANDTVNLYGRSTSGVDKVLAYETMVQMSRDDKSFTNAAYFAKNVTIDGRGGGLDDVYLHDTSFNETFTSAGGATAWEWLDAQGNVQGHFDITGCYYVKAILLPGQTERKGTQTAAFTGTAAKDIFSAKPADRNFIFTDQKTYYRMATAFDAVTGTAAGANDEIRFMDTAGDDEVTLSTVESRMAGKGYDYRALGFLRATAYASLPGADNDTAYLYGTSANDNYTGTTAWGAVYTGDYVLTASGYENIIAEGNGGADKARINGQPAAVDTLVAKPDDTTLSGGGKLHQVLHFADVTGVAPGSGDIATFYDTTEADEFRAAREPDRYAQIKRLSGGYFVRGDAFETVTCVSSPGAADNAVLYGATVPTPDVFWTDMTQATFSGFGYAIDLTGFTYLTVTAVRSGGTDTALDQAEFHYSSASDRLTAGPGSSALKSGSRTYTAKAFDAVFAEGAAGPGDEFALLSDSAGDDRLTAHGTQLDLTWADATTIRLLDIALTRLTRTTGDDTKDTDGYLLQLDNAADWREV